MNGQNFDITQGELRRIMEKRLEELREIRESMIQGGAGSSEIDALDDLINKYDETADDLEQRPADDSIIEDIEDLMKRDPEFAEAIRDVSSPDTSNQLSNNSPRTSLAAEQFGNDSMQTISLSEAFSQGGQFSEQPSTEVSQPGFDDRPLDQSLEKLGF